VSQNAARVSVRAELQAGVNLARLGAIARGSSRIKAQVDAVKEEINLSDELLTQNMFGMSQKEYNDKLRGSGVGGDDSGAAHVQRLGSFDDVLRSALDDLEPDSMTPREALEALYELKKLDRGSNRD
jgi:hypothetical protein